MKDTIRYNDDADTWQVVLKQMTLLYNYHLEKVGLNQLRNVYVPEWSQDSAYLMGGYDQADEL